MAPRASANRQPSPPPPASGGASLTARANLRPTFADSMLQNWAPEAVSDIEPVPGAATFAARRAALSAAFPGEVLVIPTGGEQTRSNDTAFTFRPGSNFYYLTGNTDPDCVLVLWPRASTGHDSVLFVEPSGRADGTFFSNPSKGEFWVGPRLGVEESLQRFGVDRCEGLPQLSSWLGRLTGRKAPPVRVVRHLSAEVDGQVAARPREDHALLVALSDLRLIKDASEVAALREAAGATRRAFDAVLGALPTARSEREVEATFNMHARIEGNGVGYGTIAAAGPHACTLHWTRNDAPLHSGDLLLIDAGVEGHSLYTADVTRTVPINGTFTPPQRAIYDLVSAAQAAGIAAVKPGASFMAPHEAANQVLVAGLRRLGIGQGEYPRRYTLHGTSHMLGLDVHDCPGASRDLDLRPGMVLTVEPGLYFQPNDLTVPAAYRGIGVRIEDDVLVTANGRSLLTDLPRTSDDVESWMASLKKAA